MTCAAKMISDALGRGVTLLDINEYDADKDGNMSEDEIATAFRAYLAESQLDVELKTDWWEQKLSLDKLNEIAEDTEGTTYIFGQAEGVHGEKHWIVLTGYSLNESGQVQFNYSASSVNDEKQNRKYILGEKTNSQGNFYTITKIGTYTLIKS